LSEFQNQQCQNSEQAEYEETGEAVGLGESSMSTSKKFITSHEQQMIASGLVQEWQDPTQKLKEEADT
jgi:hypothetical protein